MTDRVRCPVCGSESRRRRFPRHVAETHPDDRFRATFRYSAAWAAVLPAAALAVLVADVALVALEAPLPAAGREAVAAAVDVAPGRLETLGLGARASVGAVLGVALAALARGPGQRVRRGWRPARREYPFVLALALPWLGPLAYLVAASRRFVSVRFAREKLAGGGPVVAEHLADADDALASRRETDAARAFANATRLVESLAADDHCRNPTVADRLGALASACGTAATICADR